MEKTWKPTTAGILSIVAGALRMIGGIVVAVLGKAVGRLLGVMGFPGVMHGMADSAIEGIIPLIFHIVAIVGIILGIVAIVGGVYALKRRIWGLALAGSICSFFCVWFLGIPAIIFTALGKGEFKQNTGG